MAIAKSEAEAAQQLLEEKAQEAQDACDAVEAKMNYPAAELRGIESSRV